MELVRVLHLLFFMLICQKTGYLITIAEIMSKGKIFYRSGWNKNPGKSHYF